MKLTKHSISPTNFNTQTKHGYEYTFRAENPQENMMLKDMIKDIQDGIFSKKSITYFDDGSLTMDVKIK